MCRAALLHGMKVPLVQLSRVFAVCHGINSRRGRPDVRCCAVRCSAVKCSAVRYRHDGDGHARTNVQPPVVVSGPMGARSCPMVERCSVDRCQYSTGCVEHGRESARCVAADERVRSPSACELATAGRR
jgi:hypothetical protein